MVGGGGGVALFLFSDSNFGDEVLVGICSSTSSSSSSGMGDETDVDDTVAWARSGVLDLDLARWLLTSGVLDLDLARSSSRDARRKAAAPDNPDPDF